MEVAGLMHTISDDLKTHLASKNPTIAFCMSIEKADGTFLYLTSHSQNITYSGNVYIATPGATLSGLKTSDSANVDNVDAASNYSSDTVDRADLINNEVRGGAYEYFCINYLDTTMGILTLSKGTVGQTTIKDYDYNVELRSLFQNLQQEVGDLYSPYCRNTVGDAKCQVDIVGSYTHTGTVLTVTDAKTFTSNSVSPAITDDDYFQYGVLTWTSGDNDAKKMQVRESSYLAGTHTIELDHNQLYAMDIGDTFSVTAGCDLDIDGDCNTKFSNTINFNGEPSVPGRGVRVPLEVRI